MLTRKNNYENKNSNAFKLIKKYIVKKRLTKNKKILTNYNYIIYTL